MARNWQYPRWRRLLMQSSMWLILGGTVGLAALLDRHQHEQMRVTLDAPRQCGAIQLQLPAHWMIEYTDAGMVTATESTSYPPQRSLEVTVAPPAEPGLIDQLLQKRSVGVAQTIPFGPMGKSTGNLYASVVPVEEDNQSGSLGRVIATAILPDGPEVTLRLEHVEMNGDSLESQDDVDLIRRIAATVRLAPPTESPQQD